jgi:hypothetical protein
MRSAFKPMAGVMPTKNTTGSNISHSGPGVGDSDRWDLLETH